MSTVDSHEDAQESDAGQDARMRLVGTAPSIRELRKRILKAGASDCLVLIVGETGSGKELVARAIHDCSPHGDRPFMPVDCGALAPTLVESELFGYVRGAFTGAYANKQGLLEAAGGGTVLFDEIAELAPALQAKLLRTLQEREVRPVGSNRHVRLHARILAATNRNLEEEVRRGRFRKDLLYRVGVITIRVPSLRERKQDIPLLVGHFLKRAVKQGSPLSFSDEAIATLLAYDWPGNVRELESAVQSAVALSSEPILNSADLPPQVGACCQHAPPEEVIQESPWVSLRDLEREAILRAVEQAKGDKLLAARILGIGKTTVYRRLREMKREDAKIARGPAFLAAVNS